MSGPTVAYFSMEIGLQADIPTYSGGLGVLAGDMIRAAADAKIPMVADSGCCQAEQNEAWPVHIPSHMERVALPVG